MSLERTFKHPPTGLVGLLAYDPANNRYQVIHVDANGRLQIDVAASEDLNARLYGWDGDSWESLQVDGSHYLKVTLPLEEALGARSYQFDGSNWRRSNLLFGYNDRWAEREITTNANAGSNELYCDAVPAGYIYIVQFMLGVNLTSACSYIRLQVTDGVIYPILAQAISPAAGQYVLWEGSAVLKQGDKALGSFGGCTAGDDIYIDVWGYKMRLNM